jgi:hypothetical protein
MDGTRTDTLATTTAGRDVSRRAALRFLGGAGLGSLLSLGGTGAPVPGALAQEVTVVRFTRLVYRDRNGGELGQLRPVSLTDVSEQADVLADDGETALWLRVHIWNTGRDDLAIPAEAFALWDHHGFLYRPADILAPADGASSASEEEEAAGMMLTERQRRDRISWLYDVAHIQAERGQLLGTAPIPPGRERGGAIGFRVPGCACLQGLLFAPEPDQMQIVADFSKVTEAIIFD